MAVTSQRHTADIGMVESIRLVLVMLAASLADLHNWMAERFGSPARMYADPTMGVMGAVKMIGGAVIGIAVITLVVNEVLTVDSINNSTGPFSGVIDSLETTGVTAITLLVVGLLVVAAGYIMRYMDSF